MSINNDLDPVDGSVVTNARLSSDEQGLYVDSRLIDSVTFMMPIFRWNSVALPVG